VLALHPVAIIVRNFMQKQADTRAVAAGRGTGRAEPDRGCASLGDRGAQPGILANNSADDGDKDRIDQSQSSRPCPRRHIDHRC